METNLLAPDLLSPLSRYCLTHAQSGQYLATLAAEDADAAVASLLSERGYRYYAPQVIRAELLPPVQRTDAFGNPQETVQ